MEYNLEDLEWQCQDCDAKAPPTAYEYMKLIRHHKGHHIRLVNKKTGDILAATVRKARSLGIEIPSDGKTPTKSDGKSGSKPSGKPGEQPEFGMELSEEGITLPVTLPPVTFTLFDAAKAAKLTDEEMDFDHFLFKCVQKRFELDFNLQLMLVPITGEK